MRVFLLAPHPEINNNSSTQYPPLGILYLGGAIQDIVEELQILDANVLKLSVQETVNRIRKFHPDVLGLSINIVTARVAKEIVRLIKRQLPNIKIIAGGPSPTISPNEWFEYCDVVISGEGEYPLRRIIEQLKSGQEIVADCNGICLPNGIHTKGEHPDLEELPLPAYDYLTPRLQYYSKRARIVKSYMAPILTSRGCPYNCVFCDKSVHGTNFRPRSPESVLKEIKWLHDKYGVRQLDILDDNFTFDIERANKILDGIIHIDDFAINCQNGIRADRINQSLVQKMKQAGVFRVGIGIESGNPKVLKQLNKNLDLNDVIKAIKLFRKQKITVQGYFIIGLPFETKEYIIDTVKFAIKANPHFANFSHYFPVVGTKIYNELQKEGRILAEDSNIEDGFFRTNSHIDNSNITYNDMTKIYRWAWRKFYFRPYKILDMLLSIKSYKELIWLMRIAKSMMKGNLLKITGKQ